MSKFKIGDKVRLTGSEWKNVFDDFPEVVTIIGLDRDEPEFFMNGTRWYVMNDPAWGGELVESDSNGFAEKVHAVLANLEDTLVAKNQAYGDSALNPVRIFSKADETEGIKVRIDDKLSRVARGENYGEDTVTDLIGYLVMLKIAESDA